MSILFEHMNCTVYPFNHHLCSDHRQNQAHHTSYHIYGTFTDILDELLAGNKTSIGYDAENCKGSYRGADP